MYWSLTYSLFTEYFRPRNYEHHYYYSTAIITTTTTINTTTDKT